MKLIVRYNVPADNENQLYRNIWTAGQRNKGIFVKKDCICWPHSKKKKKKTLAMCNQITASKKVGKKHAFKITVADHQFNFHQTSFLTYSKERKE